MIPPRTIGSLFSGIGGLELGLEAATGARTVFQVEKELFCREVLAKHYPDAIRYDDVCTVGAHNLAPVDVICGGFPCQDLSYAGKGAGLAGERSGLWREYRRIVGELRPRYVFVENVAALLGRGLGTVLGDLSSLGYDAVWTTLRASDVGAPHRRERLFILAYANRDRREWISQRDEFPTGEQQPPRGANADGRGDPRWRAAESGDGRIGGDEQIRCCESMADARSIEPECERIARIVDGSRGVSEGEGDQRQRGGNAAGDRGQVGVDLAYARSGRPSEPRITVKPCDSAANRKRETDRPNDDGRGLAQPRVRGGAHGLSARLDAHRWPSRPGEAQHEWEAPRVTKDCPRRADRLKALGNAVVPQVAALAWRVLFARMTAAQEAA